MYSQANYFNLFGYRNLLLYLGRLVKAGKRGWMDGLM